MVSPERACQASAGHSDGQLAGWCCVLARREWDSEVVSQAIDMHDRLLRAMMSKFNGYEVMTEVGTSTGGLCEGGDWRL